MRLLLAKKQSKKLAKNTDKYGHPTPTMSTLLINKTSGKSSSSSSSEDNLIAYHLL